MKSFNWAKPWLVERSNAMFTLVIFGSVPFSRFIRTESADMAGAARRSGSTRPFRNFRMEFAYRNAPKQKPDPISKWRIVRGDVVEILSGRDRGKQGKVVKVDRRKNGLFVEGLNMVRRCFRV